MASQSLTSDVSTTRPYVDWSQFSVCQQVKSQPDYEIILLHEEMEDSYEIFRNLSHKVAHCRYDVPLEHKVIVAYAKFSDSCTPDKAIGVITFWISHGSICRDQSNFVFMDQYFHQISFLFIDPEYQRQGIGTKLIEGAISKIKESGLNRPIHLEGAKSAVKFFRKKGFVSLGKAEKGSAHRGSRLFSSYFNMQRKFPS